MLALEKIEDFDLYKNGCDRKLFVHKGPSFDQSESKVVFLLHDAQNFFSQKHATIKISWGLKSTLRALNIQNYLAFGIKSLDWIPRLLELSPFKLRKDLEADPAFQTTSSTKPGGKKYLEALFKNLVPHMEKRHQFTLKNVTSIMIGSSMGGLVTTYLAKKSPDYLSGYIAFSSALYANEPQIFSYLQSKKNKMRNYYHYMGGNEHSGNISTRQQYVESYQFMENYLKTNSPYYGGFFDPNGIHSEASWKKHLPGAITWVLQNSTNLHSEGKQR